MEWDAIARFLAGESPPAEVESVSKWLADHPEEAGALIASHDAALRAGGQPHAPVDVNAAWQRASARLDPASAARRSSKAVRARREISTGAAPVRSVWTSPVLRAAASVALIAGGGALIWQARNGERTGTPTAVAREFVTAPAQRDSVVLTDGTGVLLGPGSSLRVEAGYGNDRRAVRLEGEALFDVRHDDARPFVVHTSDVLIHDLGTTFSVRTATGTRGITSVAVTVGAVRVARESARGDSGVVLREGEMADVGTGPIVLRREGLEDALAWTRGRLVFRATPLPEVASALERWYGVRVEITDRRLDARTLTASFEGDGLADVMRVIGLALDVPVRQIDGVVVMGSPPAPGKTP
jgi:transmembrane sensor